MLLNEDTFEVTVLDAHLRIDLGGIGKGFALDKTVEMLKEWGIKSALIHGGRSSVYAFGADWPVSLSDPINKKKIANNITLNGRALSGSGLDKGSHIIDPRNGRTVKNVRAAWAFATSAAASDALSTAFMILSEDELNTFFKHQKDVSAVLIMQDGTKRAYNRY